MNSLGDILGFVARTGLALTAIVAFIWFMAKRASRSGAGTKGPSLKVLSRVTTSRHTSVTVVAVGTRRLLLGVSEQNVTLLTELGPGPDLAASTPAPPVAATTPVPADPKAEGALFATHLSLANTAVSDTSAPTGRLAGSILSSATWRSAAHAVASLTGGRRA